MADRTRPGWVVPVGAAAGALVVTAVVAPEILTGSVSDVETMVRVAAFGLAIAGWVWLVPRFVRGPLTGALRVVPVVAVLAWVLWPYVRPATSIDEDFPVAVVAPTTLATSPASAAPSTSTSTSTSTSIVTETPSSVSAQASVPPSTTTVPPATTVTAPEPAVVRSGGFQGLTGHRGSGAAVLYDLGGGTPLLRFEDVDIGSGPKLEIYLVPGVDQRGLSGGIHVASLKAEQGNHNYDLPAGVSLADVSTGDWTVLVWCETFAVEVANATLA